MAQRRRSRFRRLAPCVQRLVRPGQQRVGFYGIDLYSLHASMEAVVSYLDKVDPDAASRARARYACFDHYGEDSQAYGLSRRASVWGTPVKPR